MTFTHAAALRRLAAGAGVLVLGLSGLGVATVASAADGNIDVDATGSIIIHKQEAGSQGQDGSPDGQTATGGIAVADVVFTAYKITNLDLSTQAAWDTVATTDIPASSCGDDFATPSLKLANGEEATFDSGAASQATDAAGETTIDNLPVAAYLVCETSAPTTVRQKASPFLVTVPFPNNEVNSPNRNDNEWLYDVNVYPKNVVVLAPAKEIEVDEAKHGIKTAEQVTFPVSVEIPSLDFSEDFTYFVISDPFNENLENVKITSVTLGDDPVDDRYVVKTDGQTASVGFTAQGLDFLKTQPNEVVQVIFSADVKSFPADNGVIPNVAMLYLDTHPSPEGIPASVPPTAPDDIPSGNEVLTNVVSSNWGDLTITKVDKDNTKALSGATFEIYNATPDTAYAADCSAAVKTGAPVAVDGTTQFTTGADGSVTVDGLFIDAKSGPPLLREEELLPATLPQGEFVDATGATPEHNTRCYVLVETKAPAGYALPSADGATRGVMVKAGIGNTDTVTVTNAKQNVPSLPLTGAAGRVLLMALGAALVLLAVGSGLVKRYREARALR